MSTIYIDRNGDEWKKNCSGCHRRTSKDGGRTYCEGFSEFLSDNRQFSNYYNQYPNSCPHFAPKSG